MRNESQGIQSFHCTSSPLSHPQHKLWHGDRLKLDTIVYQTHSPDLPCLFAHPPGNVPHASGKLADLRVSFLYHSDQLRSFCGIPLANTRLVHRVEITLTFYMMSSMSHNEILTVPRTSGFRGRLRWRRKGEGWASNAAAVPLALHHLLMMFHMSSVAKARRKPHIHCLYLCCICHVI